VADPDLIAIPTDEDGVRGFLHEPRQSLGRGMVLTHGAGSNCSSPLLVKLAEAFRGAGVSVLRCDLPFRQGRRVGPPSPKGGELDRAGLKAAVFLLRGRVTGGVILAGHSYGGRQASMLAADEPELAESLLLLSYPLHPPRKPDQLRVQHFPRLRTPAAFVHGTADPFASIAELNQAIAAIPAQTRLIAVEGAGHDLGGKRFDADRIVATVLA